MISLPEFSQNIQKKIQLAKRVILFLHKSPDLDSIGSNFGFVDYIKNLNSTAEIIILSTDIPSESLNLIINNYSEINLSIIEVANFEFQNGDLSVSIDFSEIHRASRVEGFIIPEFVDQAIIDHHVIPEIKSKLNFIETQNISASTIIFKLYKEAKIEISLNTYKFLIFGILGDSGSLRYKDNNFLTSLEIIREFCEKYGTINYFEIVEMMERNMPVQEYILEGIYLNNLVYDEEKKYAYTYMTLEDRQKKGIPTHYVEFLNGATVIKNIGLSNFTFSVTEDKKEANKFNLSFRSCSGTGFVVRDIAAKLGGGGHLAAAGAQIEAKSLNEALERVKTAIHELDAI